MKNYSTKEQLYVNELWEELKTASINMFYLDEFRDKRALVEPLYRGVTSAVALVASVAAFSEGNLFVKVMSTITALMSTAPLLFPFLPMVSDFSKIGTLRVKLKNYQIDLEELWGKGVDLNNESELRGRKRDFAPIESELYALFGKINKQMYGNALKHTNNYLSRFDTQPILTETEQEQE